MKHLCALALTAAAMLCGCTGSAAPQPVPVEKGKVAVIFYSWSGNTRFAAETIARTTGAELFELKPVTPYSTDFRTCCSEAKPECMEKKPRPLMPVNGLDLAKYDVIFIGSPNWWSTLAPPVHAFVRDHAADFKGKTLCLFVTHGTGGIANLARDFTALLPGVKLLSPGAFPGATVKSSAPALEEFVRSRITVK